jgi:hypothetical protein
MGARGARRTPQRTAWDIMDLLLADGQARQDALRFAENDPDPFLAAQAPARRATGRLADDAITREQLCSQ